jgi:hypothetical protein
LTPDKRPTFLYRFADLKVEDTPNPKESESGLQLVRKLKFSGKVDKNVWFRAARSGKIQQASGWYVIDGLRLQIETSNSASPQVRQQDGANELLIPVSSPMVITQRFSW